MAGEDCAGAGAVPGTFLRAYPDGWAFLLRVPFSVFRVFVLREPEGNP